MDILQKLEQEKQQLVQKREAARMACNRPLTEQYNLMLEVIEKKINEAKS